MGKLRNEDSIAIQKKLLKISGLWPRRSPTFTNNLWTTTSYLVMYLNFGFVCYSLCVSEDFHQFTRNFTFFMELLTHSLKITMFYFNRPKLLKLLDFLKNSMFHSYHDDLEKHLAQAIKTSFMLMRAFQIVLYPTALLLCVTPVFETGQGRQLPVDFGLTKAIRKSVLLCIILYVLQGFGIFFAANGAIGVDGIPSGLMGLAAAHFKILQGTIVQATKPLSVNENRVVTIDDCNKVDKETDKKLKKCVDLHFGIITFVNTIEEIFTYTFLLQFLVSGVSICVAGFFFLLTSPRSFEFLFTLGSMATLLFQISLCCIFGDEVIQQSLKVQEACYATDWVQCGPKMRKTLFIIMERSKRPSVLTAGGFVNLSIASLVAILRSAYSYATVLQQFYNR